MKKTNPELLIFILFFLFNYSVFAQFNYDDQVNQQNENLREMMESKRSDEEYARINSYDGSNYNRFANSPCFEEIGYHPSRDQDNLDKEYNDCEKEKRNKENSKKIKSSLFVISFILVLTLVIYFHLTKKKKVFKSSSTYSYSKYKNQI